MHAALRPEWWRFQIQRRVTDLSKREARADRIAARMPAPEQTLPTSLAEDGFVMLPPADRAKVEAMRAWFGGHRVRDHYRPELGEFRHSTPPPEVHVANYADAVVANAPFALDIANDAQTLAAVSAVLGCKPTVTQMGAWWSYPHGGPAEHAELWHRDVDDYRFLKLFVFLTDVDEESGPHSYIRGSHRSTMFKEVGRRIPDEIINRAFGHRLKTFTGAAGTRFLENTYGFHRGTPPIQRPRLLFQVVYGQRALFGGPKRSLGLPPRGYDPWVNRLFH